MYVKLWGALGYENRYLNLVVYKQWIVKDPILFLFHAFIKLIIIRNNTACKAVHVRQEINIPVEVEPSLLQSTPA